MDIITIIGLVGGLALGAGAVVVAEKNLKKEEEPKKKKSSEKASGTAAEYANDELSAQEKQNQDTKKYIESTKNAAKQGVTFQVDEIKVIRLNLKNLLDDFYIIKKKTRNYPVNNDDLNRLLRDILKIKTDYEKLSSFSTNNDKIMSSMSNKDYEESDASIQTARNTEGLALVKQGLDTQTNDLGYSIFALTDAVKKGINNIETMNNAINWTESSINITNRMERDLVLEEQMIEKINI